MCAILSGLSIGGDNELPTKLFKRNIVSLISGIAQYDIHSVFDYFIAVKGTNSSKSLFFINVSALTIFKIMNNAKRLKAVTLIKRVTLKMYSIK